MLSPIQNLLIFGFLGVISVYVIISLNSTKKIFMNVKNFTNIDNNLFLSPNSFDLFFKKFTNLLMIDGKKTKASRILFNMLVILKKRIKKELEKKNQPLSVQNSMNFEKEVLRENLLNNPKLDKLGNSTDAFQNSKNIGPSKDIALKQIPLNIELLRVISQALENITPSLEVRKVRVAGSTYLVPAVLSKKKQETMALKWLIESAKKRQKNSRLDFSTCLADEILDASRKLGQTRQKRDELHRLAQMNRAYARYRWW